MKAYLEPAEVQRLEEAATNLRDRLLLRLLSHLGCRVSEALALTVEDIDLDAGTVTIEHLKARIRLVCPSCSTRLGKTHEFCPKCGAKVKQAIAESRAHRRMRTLPLDSGTLKMLREYIDRGGPVERDGKNLIFGVGRGQAWRVIKECAERAGLEKLVNPESGKVHNISPHRLRDAFAVMAVQHDDSTDSLRMLQEQLGHTNIGTTMRYRKVAGQELKEWYERLWSNKETVDG